MKAGWRLTHCEHYGFASVAPPWQSCHTSPFSESWFPLWVLISLRCHVVTHIPAWQSGTPDARRNLYYPCRSAGARALLSSHSMRGGGGERGRGQVNQIRSNFGESSEEDVREQTHKKMRKRGDKRSTERDSRGADCVRSPGAFWQPDTLLPWPADKECGGCARKSAEKVREVKFEFFLFIYFFFKIRKWNFNDPCGGISLAQQQM